MNIYLFILLLLYYFTIKVLSYVYRKTKRKYCLSKKQLPIVYRKVLYKMGQDFLDIQYYVIPAFYLHFFIIVQRNIRKPVLKVCQHQHNLISIKYKYKFLEQTADILGVKRINAVCLDPSYLITYYINWAKTSRTYCRDLQ